MNATTARRPTDLPVEAHAAEIVAAITAGSLVLTAEPGAGKSSIVPLLAAQALSAGAGRAAGRSSTAEARRVLVLEPRRLAARATAQRLAHLLGEGRVGDAIGLTMRGERRVSDDTIVEVMTEAVLTARLHRDPELPNVGAIVFDEFHERSLHSDLGLAMALEAGDTIRPDLALVVMSATFDPGPVAALLGTDRVVDVPGRTYPVETIHLVRPSKDRWADGVAQAAGRALAEVTGDVLVFVPGRREINDVIQRLGASEAARGVAVVGLHGGSDGRAQQRALAASSGRRVIVATAVAETSVTLPGIEAVVDGGLARRARFDPRTGLGRLETLHVTRFSADQRRGRAGRLGPGRCYRLWSAEDHRLLDEAVPPEILEGDPLPVAYELARWGDPDGIDLPLLDHPGQHRLDAGRDLLATLGLLDDDAALTERGVAAGRLGIHPRLGALLLTALEQGLTGLGATVAALLDDDRWPTSPDLGAEVEQRWSELDDRSSRLLRRLGAPRGRTRRQLPELGGLLAAAWPDRVAQRRPQRPGQYLMANGREGVVDARGPLVDEEFLVVAEADGSPRQARIRRAVPVDRATLRQALAGDVTWCEEVGWDDRSATIQAERQQRIGAIVLHREPLNDPPPDLVAKALATGLRRSGLSLLRWNDTALGHRQRLAWLHSVDSREWPAVDDESLIGRIDEWLDLSGIRSAADLAKLGVGSKLLSLLDWRQRAAFDEQAPEALALPGGGRRRLDYSSGRPVLAVRVQQLFGLDRHPVVGPRATPVTIELLSPAGRPAQVTNDLPGFWRHSYAEVRRDLRGRYPKHDWPEEPWLAEPPTPRRR